MKLLIPETITDANLTSSNVPETDFAEWDVAATYAVTDKVIVIATHRVYESVIASNLGNDPTTAPDTVWLDISATNRWKAFDEIIGNQATNPLSIEYVFDTTGIINSVALFGLDIATLQIVATSLTDGEVYNKTVNLVDNSAINSWHDWYFEPVTRRTRYVAVDLPQYVDASVKLIASVPSGNASIGQIVIGRQRVIGDTELGTTVGIRDYSIKGNDIYGNPALIERPYSDTVDFDIALKTSSVEGVRNLIADYRARPVVWIGDENADYGVLLYGYYKDFTLVLESTSISRASILVEGLV